MGLADSLVTQLLQCQVSFWHLQVRLQADTDTEALHDLRIELRRLRSLLRPLRKHAAIAQLETLAAELSRRTTTLRDLEVLTKHLQQQGLNRAAAVRQSTLQAGYEQLRGDRQLIALLALLDSTPATIRNLEQQGTLRGQKPLKRYLYKQCRQLVRALEDPVYDRHRLRLLIKRVRYANEMHYRQSPLSTSIMQALKELQATLGDWHDLSQWCQLARSQADLQPLQVSWSRKAKQALDTAEGSLHKLAKQLRKQC